MTATNIIAVCFGVAIVITIGVFVWQFINPQHDIPVDVAPYGSAS